VEERYRAREGGLDGWRARRRKADRTQLLGPTVMVRLVLLVSGGDRHDECACEESHTEPRASRVHNTYRDRTQSPFFGAPRATACQVLPRFVDTS